MKPILCYHKISKRNFLVVQESEQVICSKCGSVIEFGGVMYVHHCYSKIAPFKKNYFCSEKCSKNRVQREQDEFRTAILTSLIPENVIFITDHPSDMTTGRNISVFQAASLESEHTTDRTIHSERESIRGASVGDKKYLTHGRVKGRNISAKDIDILLNASKEQKPMLTKSERKQIEKK